MIHRFLLVSFVTACIAAANPVTAVVSGVGSGTFNGLSFNAAKFTVTMTADSAKVMRPPCCPSFDLPGGSPATLAVQGFANATIMDTQTIFVESGTIGLAHFNDGDLVDLDNPLLAGYAFATSIGPLTGSPSFVGSCPGVDCSSFQTSAGTFNFSSVSTVTFTITVGPAAPPPPTITKVVDGAAGTTHIAPGMPVEVTGMNFGNSATDAASFSIADKPAPILSFNTSTDVVIQAPVDAPTGATTLTATYKGMSSAAFSITLSTFAPAIFGAVGSGGGSFYDSAGKPITATHAAAANLQVYALAAGLGPTDPPQVTNTVASESAATTTPVQVMIGSKMLTPDYAGLFVGGTPGTYQVSFTLPSDVAIGNDAVVLIVGGLTSNSATLTVGPPVPFVTAVVNGATFGTKPPAPNSFVTIFGGNFGSSDTASSIFPSTSFKDLSVLVNDMPVPIYFVFASSDQIILVLPSELPESGVANVQVKTSQGTSAAFMVQMEPSDVGMFRITDPSKPSRHNAAALFANTVWRVMPASMAAAIGFPPCQAAKPLKACGQPAKAGDSILVFLTGEGKATPNGDPNGKPLPTGTVAPANGSPLYKTVYQPTVTIGGVQVKPGFSGITPGNAGLYQLNLTVPGGVTGDDVDLTVTMPDGSTDTVTIAIQ